MGFFDEVFGDPDKQFKKDIERWKKEDEAWMNEIREDDRLWQKAGGDPILYDELKALQRVKKSYDETVDNFKRTTDGIERHRKSMSGNGGFDRLMNRAYSRAMDRDADRMVRELEREGRKYD